MNEFFKNIIGMEEMSDQVITTDFLMSVKSGIRNLAFAITETATPELKAALREQLRSSLDVHANVTDYMIDKGYYHPYDLNEQLQVDLKASETALNLTDQ